MSESDELLSAVLEIRDLVRLMAEPAIAERDRKLRGDLRRIAGRSAANAQAVLRMDGTRSQTNIHSETGINKGNLSTLIKKLSEARLIAGDARRPKLTISVPSNFFETGDSDE